MARFEQNRDSWSCLCLGRESGEIEETCESWEPDQKASEDGVLRLGLPETLFGALLSAHLNQMWNQVPGLWLWAIIAMVCQIYCVIMMGRFTFKVGETCSTEADTFLKMICTFILVTIVGTKMVKQVDTMRYISRFPATDLGVADGDLKFQSYNMSVPGFMNIPVITPLTRLRCFPFSIFLFFVFYELSLSVAFLIRGAPYILQAKESEDTILNAVALTFILDFDSALYHFAIDKFIKARLFDKMETTIDEPLFLKSRTYQRLINLRPVILAVGASVGTAFLWLRLCGPLKPYLRLFPA